MKTVISHKGVETTRGGDSKVVEVLDPLTIEGVDVVGSLKSLTRMIEKLSTRVGELEAKVVELGKIEVKAAPSATSISKKDKEVIKDSKDS